MATKIINNWPTKCKTFYSYKVLTSKEPNVKIFPRTNHTFQETYMYIRGNNDGPQLRIKKRLCLSNT